MEKRRKFNAEYKAEIVLSILSGTKTAAEICRQHDLKPQLLSDWKAEFVEHAGRVFANDKQLQGAEERIAELERLVGQQALELEMAKKVSRRSI